LSQNVFWESLAERIRQQIDEIRLTQKGSFGIIYDTCQEVLNKAFFTLALHEVMDFLFSLNITGTTNLPDSAFLIRSHVKWD
jgi:hypothetical protein